MNKLRKLQVCAVRLCVMCVATNVTHLKWNWKGYTQVTANGGKRLRPTKYIFQLNKFPTQLTSWDEQKNAIRNLKFAIIFVHSDGPMGRCATNRFAQIVNYAIENFVHVFVFGGIWHFIFYFQSWCTIQSVPLFIFVCVEQKTNFAVNVQ